MISISDFKEKLESAMDYVSFKVSDRGFTFLNWPINDISIGEWGDKPGTVQHFRTVDEMLEKYMINGKPLKDCVSDIIVKDMC